MTFIDHDAEYAVLAGLMTWPDGLDRVAGIVSAEHFATPERRAIFGAITSLIVAGRDPDVVTVRDALRDQSPEITLADLTAIAQAASSRGGLKAHAEIVRKMAGKRTLVRTVLDAEEIAMSGDDDALERVVALVNGLTRQSVRRMPKAMSSLMLGRVEHYERMAAGEVEKAWPTQIPELDRLLSGGLRGGKVYVIAARPKVGKSSLAQAMAQVQAKAGRPALILSQEMGEEELADRAIANEGQVDYSALLTGKMTHDQWVRMSEGVEGISRLPLYVDDHGGLTLADIRTKARSIKGLKLLVIDYLQLCSGSAKPGSNRNTEIEEISRGIKTLAKELDIAVLLLSQLNRKVEERANKQPQLSDLRDSGSIEQDADAVIFLWRARDHKVNGARVIGCEVAANRCGPPGDFAFDFIEEHQRWSESLEKPHFVPLSSAPRRKTKGFGEE